jgi:hypothetical protein
MAERPTHPNVLFFHVDNLGLGELGCYGGGMVRGADTRRIDGFAREGLQLWHYIAEPQCTPSRSALMTGRYAVRSGTHTIAAGGETGGIVAWERTMGDILSEAGYATACLGKWHIGAEDGRWPTDHGFDQWYGPPRSYTECMWLEDPWYEAGRDLGSYMLEGDREHGVTVRHDQQLTMDLKRDIDAEYMRRGVDFVRRSVAADRPFYLYFNHSLMHMPTIPRPEFKGKSKNGDWADCLLELDDDFGALLDLLDELGIADNTIVVFAGDMFTTLLRWVGCETPDDREIDGLDQRAFFEGRQEESSREGCLVWLKDTLHGVKWRNFKVMFVRQRYFDEEPRVLSTPHVINLVTDPKEREAHNQQYLHSWVQVHSRRLVTEFRESTKREPLIPAGSAVGYVPTRGA